jgi:hypothetical protein
LDRVQRSYVNVIPGYHLGPAAALGAVRHSAPFGIPRRSAFRAVRHSAPFGIPRRLASGAVRHLAPFG